ncbi:MAG TPA: TIGR03986 family CRISPR-associated RAMP protein [bacterium]|nr:TIGR03986 family CRISPR-associated RAMP protein [bacterium]
MSKDYKKNQYKPKQQQGKKKSFKSESGGNPNNCNNSGNLKNNKLCEGITAQNCKYKQCSYKCKKAFNSGNPPTRAPYNFIPLYENPYDVSDGYQIASGEKLKPWEKNDTYHPGLLSGVIHLDIKTEKPTYVGCGIKKEDADMISRITDPDKKKAAEKKLKRDFFFSNSETLEPVIPGSSIRGMTRSLVEILTCGKFTDFVDDRFMYRAVFNSDPVNHEYKKVFKTQDGFYPSRNIKCGYLHINGVDWSIIPANEHLINEELFSFVHITPKKWEMRNNKIKYNDQDIIGRKIKLKLPSTLKGKHIGAASIKYPVCCDYIFKDELEMLSGVKKAEYNSYVEAVIFRTGSMGSRKHYHCAVFEKQMQDSKSISIEIPDRIKNVYLDDTSAKKGIDARPLKDGSPVFYAIEKKQNNEKLVFFGPTMFFRLPYEKSISDYVPPELKNEKAIDMAEAMFGTVDDGNRIIKGRLSFEDAPLDPQQMENNNNFDPFLQTPANHPEKYQGLWSPKILGGPKATAVQNYLLQHPPQKRNDPIMNWNSKRGTANALKNDETLIRGYKRYWHKPNADENFIFENLPVEDSQHVVMKPVRGRVHFCGKIKFNNITHLELGALLAALDLPSDMRHQIGMGKPRGMGSVQITPTLELIDRKERYQNMMFATTRTQENTNAGESSDIKELKKNALSLFLTTFERWLGKKECEPHVQLSSNSNNGNHSYDDIRKSIWELGRNSELSKIMDWKNAPDQNDTDYHPIGIFRDNNWSNRYILREIKHFPFNKAD